MVPMRSSSLLIFLGLSIVFGVQLAAADCHFGSVPGRHGPDACYYKLTIVEITDAKLGQVKGRVSEDTLQQEKKDNPLFDINAYPRDPYTFLVIDFANANIQKDKTYEFMSVPNTFYLQKIGG